MVESSKSIREFVLRHLIALGIVWTLVLLFVALAKHRSFDEHLRICIVVGAGFGLVNVAAGWLALGPMGWSIRLPGSTVLASVAMAATVSLFALIEEPAGGIIRPMLYGATAQFCILPIPLWALRALHGLQMVHVTSLAGERDESRLQFNLWEMMLGMTLVATVLGVGRWLHMLVEWMSPNDVDEQMPVFFALYVGFNLLLAWPLIWAVLSPGQSVARVFLALTLAVVVTLSEDPVFNRIIGPGGGTMFFWQLNVPYLLCVTVHLVVTRMCGYRLVRSSRATPADSVNTQN